ncbi:MAG TPA: hypothetical protein VGA43_05275, partial [Deferrimonas sp.]
MMRNAAVAEELRAALAIDPLEDGDRELIAFLAARGIASPTRAAANLRLLAYTFPPASLRTITLAALSSPVPDMALNNLERI